MTYPAKSYFQFNASQPFIKQDHSYGLAQISRTLIL